LGASNLGHGHLGHGLGHGHAYYVAFPALSGRGVVRMRPTLRVLAAKEGAMHLFGGTYLGEGVGLGLKTAALHTAVTQRNHAGVAIHRDVSFE